MTKLAKVIRASNWRYATGEVFLIVVGVSLALAATSWYEDKQRAKDENRILLEIHQALTVDLDNLNGWRNDVARYIAGLRNLQPELVSGKECSTTALENLGFVSAFRIIYINQGPYEALKSQGLDIVSDDALRMNIVGFYDSQWPDLVTTIQINYEFATSQSIPYMMANFHRPGSRSWVPHDNSICGNDPYLRNLVTWRLGSLEGFERPDYDDAIHAAELLLGEIAMRLGI